jgi:hypothetical protein
MALSTASPLTRPSAFRWTVANGRYPVNHSQPMAAEVDPLATFAALNSSPQSGRLDPNEAREGGLAVEGTHRQAAHRGD